MNVMRYELKQLNYDRNFDKADSNEARGWEKNYRACPIELSEAQIPSLFVFEKSSWKIP